MAQSRRRTRRPSARAFRPTVDERLEARELLSGFTSPFGKNYLLESAYLLHVKSARAARNVKAPPQLAHNVPHFNNTVGFHVIRYIGTQTAHGGQDVEVTAPDGSHYMVSLSYTSNTLATNTAEGANGQDGNSSPTTVGELVATQGANYPQPIGTIRAYPMTGGRVGFIVDGSTQNTSLTINPLGEPQRRGFAHSFAYGESTRTHFLNVGQLTVTSGAIGDILGFQDADLVGPLVVSGTGAIDRIAFANILPGASITTGGDVNTLDVLDSIDISGAGTGISIGRDLNLLNVGTDLDISDGATFTIGRNLGLVNQPPKGTGTGTNVLTLNFNTITNTTITVAIPAPVGSFIQGNLNIDTANGSAFLIGSSIFNTMYIEGAITGFSGLLINTSTVPTSPPFEDELTSNPAGFVTALGGATG